MRAGYTTRGLAAWQERVPLPLAIPPGDPSTWTCLLTELTPAVALKLDSYGGPLMPTTLLRWVLERLGHTATGQMPHPLLLVAPIPKLTRPLIDVIATGLGDPMREHEVARALTGLGDPAAARWLDQHAASQEQLSTQMVDALGFYGDPAPLLRWDGMNDTERLRALARRDRLPDELPPSLSQYAAALPDLDPDALRELFGEFDRTEPAGVEAVAWALFHHPGAAAAVEDALLPQLTRCTDQPLWCEVVARLCHGPDGEDAAARVVEQLATDDWRQRMGAAVALGASGTPHAVTLEGLRKALVDGDPDVRREAGLALTRLGETAPVETWTERYGFLDRASAHPWGAALNGGPVPLSLFALLTRREDVLGRAAMALGLAHPDLAAPTLQALATDGTHETPLPARQAAAAALLLTGNAPSDRGDTFRVLLRDIDDQGTSGPVAGLSEGGLATLIARDADWQVRYAALGLLGRMGAAPRHDALLASLLESESDGDVRNRAMELRGLRWRVTGVPEALARVSMGSRVDGTSRARALAELGRDAPELVDELGTALLEHPDRDIALEAARIVGRRGTAPVALAAWGLRAVGASEWIRREVGATLLGCLAAALAPDAREEIVEILEGIAADDDDGDVRRVATWAVARIGEVA